MLAASGSSVQDIAASRILIILGAIALVAYWRSILKLMIMILVVAAVVLLGAGAFELLNATHV